MLKISDGYISFYVIHGTFGGFRCDFHEEKDTL